MAFHWITYQWLSVGTGPSANYSPTFKGYVKDTLWNNTPYKRKEIGAMFFTGFYYRHLLLECNYYQGMKISEVQGSTFQPLRSINFTLSYLVKLHRKKKGDKTRRERF